MLKGHEDLRQDERVMQLFGLVNTLLAGDQETSKRHLGCVHFGNLRFISVSDALMFSLFLLSLQNPALCSNSTVYELWSDWLGSSL